MPLYQIYTEGEIRVGVWKADEDETRLLACLDHLEWVTDEPGVSLDSLSAKRRHERLSVRVLLRELCGEEKQIAYEPSGRPYLVDGSAQLSISHTSGYVAVALHPTRPVGVDIEQYGTRVHKVASRFLREDEAATLTTGDATYGLLLHWSAKETLFKLLGMEGVDFLQHLQLLPFTLQDAGTCWGCEYRTSVHRRYLLHYVTHADFVLTWGQEVH